VNLMLSMSLKMG